MPLADKVILIKNCPLCGAREENLDKVLRMNLKAFIWIRFSQYMSIGWSLFPLRVQFPTRRKGWTPFSGVLLGSLQERKARVLAWDFSHCA